MAAVKEEQGKPAVPVNFFKVDITGWSFLSNARYMSDYFDKSAVDAYFGTFKQPEQGQSLSPSTGNGTKLVALDGQGGGGEFILLLSTNADAFADAIGAIAQSEAIAKDLVRLANKDKFVAASDTTVAAKIRAAEASTVDAAANCPDRNHRSRKTGRGKAANPRVC
jgi:hypothetical protein